MKTRHASFILLTVTVISVYYGLTIGDSLNRLAAVKHQSNESDLAFLAGYVLIVAYSFVTALLIFLFTFTGYCRPGVAEQFFWNRDVPTFCKVTSLSSTGAFFGSLAFGAIAAPVSITFFSWWIFIAVAGLTQTYMFFYRLAEATVTYE